MASFNAQEDANHRTRNQTGQCAPMQSPPLGTLKLVAGNGTSIGTVMTLQCPYKYRAVSGGRVSCVQDSDVALWSGGQPQCIKVPRYEDQGFRLAVLLSIISTAIIIFMSIIFITSCLLKRVRKEERRRMERQRKREDEALWQHMDIQEVSEGLYSHKERNNNNNNSKPQQHTAQPIHQSAASPQPCTLSDQQAACRVRPISANSVMVRLDLGDVGVTNRHSEKSTDISTMAGQPDRYHEQLQQDSQFLCSEQRVGTELLDKLVLQLNRIYPQILTDREAQKFRKLSVPAATRLAELVSHLQGKGEEACHEFYRALHLHNEDLYLSLPTCVYRREAPELSGTNPKPFRKERSVLNDRGPLFFLCCFSIALGLALLHYRGEEEFVTGSVLSCTTLGLGQHAKQILLSYSYSGTKMD
ncbi:hypothetical protein NFI96_032952 [Prochilodus magdalenae]|nr:hypothetical protein NFI96_032952 [Prochilodus magdalenae]